MKERNTQKARRVGEKYAEHMFMYMEKSSNAGPKFTWKGFPLMVARIAEAGLFLEFSHNTKHMLALEKICRRAALRRAKQLVLSM